MTEEKTPIAGTKYDADKLRYDLMPPLALEKIIEIFTIGSKKYGDRNWEKGIASLRLYAAIMRHMQEWRKGNDIDEESGLLHLAHAACNLSMMLHFACNNEEYKTCDNRSLFNDR